MKLRHLVFSALLLWPAALSAQSLPFSIRIDSRIGYLRPVGDFAGSEEGFAADRGYNLAAGATLFAFPGIGLFAGYDWSRFGCEQCAAAGLEDQVIVEGLEAGFELGLSTLSLPASPWVRAGILYQTVGFSGFDAEVVSDPGVGLTAGAGITIPLLAGLELLPAIRYYTVPAEYDFETVPDRNLTASSISFDAGLSYRIGG